MRFYASKFPEVDELVMVQVKQIQEMGAYVKLLEYDNIEGMILLSELSRRRIRSIQKLIRVGRNEVVVVMRVDKEKGYIDLSKRRVSAEDVIKCEERYNKSKTVHSIMRHVAEKSQVDMEVVNEMVAWPLYRKWGHAFEAFKVSITEPESVFGELTVPADILEDLRANIARRLTPQPVKVRADLQLSNFAYSGILAIQSALAAGEAISTAEIPIKIRLVAPPLYVMVSNTTDKQGAIDLLEKAIEIIGDEIRKEEGGSLVVTMKPKAVSETDDLELAALMDRVARENKEVSEDAEDADERLRNLNRYQLAAALLEYDDQETEQPSSRAFQSAVLSPFRHILAPAPIPQESEGLRPGEYGRSDAGRVSTEGSGGGRAQRGASGSAPLSDNTGGGRGSSLDVRRSSFGDDLNQRYSRTQFGELADPDEEERLAGEWGLDDLLSQLGSPTSSAGFELVKGGRLPLPGESDRLETRSEPDFAHDRTSTNFTMPSAAAANASKDKAAPQTRLRILDRPSGARNRTQSALELPTFEELPSFDASEDLTVAALARPSVLNRPRPKSGYSLSGVSGVRSDEGESPPRPSEAAAVASSSSVLNRPRPRSSFSISGISAISGVLSDDADSPARISTSISRPLSHISHGATPSRDLNFDDAISTGFEPAQTGMTDAEKRRMSTFSTTPSAFTSRFDPTMLALAKQELEKDRPVFANKEAGAPPRMVLMPAPLAGQPIRPPKPPRVEGPEPDSEPEELADDVADDEDALKPQRPAGALYGRSLMDVLDERANMSKARQRQYVPGQDGRRSMMDWGKPAADVKLADMDDEDGALVPPKALVPRSKSHMSIFGPDLVYQRDAARRLEIDKLEAEEREEEEKREAEVWERERLKQEKKQDKKNAKKNLEVLAAQRKLEGRSPSRLNLHQAANVPPSPDPPNTPPPRASMAPSLSMPRALDANAGPAGGSSWFAPPSPRSIASSRSSDDTPRKYEPARHRPPSPESPPIQRRPPPRASRTSAEQVYALRTAVMLGKMTPQQAAAEASHRGLKMQDVADDDQRPLGERLSNQLEHKSPPPKLRINLSTDGLSLTADERAELTGLSRTAPPSVADSDEDDIPLGLRKISLQKPADSDEDDDDVPLGLRHPQQPSFDDEDEDDRPLGLAVPGLQPAYGAPPGVPFYAQAQAQAQAQHAQAWMQYQHQSTLMAMQSQAALGMAHGGYQEQQWGDGTSGGVGGAVSPMPYSYGQPGGDGGMVEKWRRGVSLEQ